MERHVPFRILCGLLGLTWLVAGLGAFGMFLGYHAPGGRTSGLFHTMGPQGHYFAAFAGCALVVWSLALLAAVRRPLAGRAIGTASALGLVLCALMRVIAWVVGDYAALGNLLRVESAVFLLLALGFVWLRPPVREAA